eukprot:687060-Prorocentrum_lima.AAC.1
MQAVGRSPIRVVAPRTPEMAPALAEPGRLPIPLRSGELLVALPPTALHRGGCSLKRRCAKGENWR